MLVIGLTGGIGSGKSTVANLFAEKNIVVIDTDQIARDITQLGQPALKKIHERFGDSVIQKDGGLNRAALRQKVFANKKERHWLEQTLHPLIRVEMKKMIDEAHSPYCLVVIPLLFETEPNSLIDRALVVDATKENQIKRTQQRDKASLNEITAILDSQASRGKRLSLADDLIENNGSIDDLRPQVERLHRFYIDLAKKTFI